MITSILQFEDCVITVSVLTSRDTDVGVDLSVLAEPAVDLGKVPLDSGDVVGVELVTGGRNLDLHQCIGPWVVGPLGCPVACGGWPCGSDRSAGNAELVMMTPRHAELL
jgi:hypothetical protein